MAKKKPPREEEPADLFRREAEARLLAAGWERMPFGWWRDRQGGLFTFEEAVTRAEGKHGRTQRL